MHVLFKEMIHNFYFSYYYYFLPLRPKPYVYIENKYCSFNGERDLICSTKSNAKSISCQCQFSKSIKIYIWSAYSHALYNNWLNTCSRLMNSHYILDDNWCEYVFKNVSSYIIYMGVIISETMVSPRMGLAKVWSCNN